MKVFKFGGASVSTVERIKNVGSILQSYGGEKILIVVSAMGKTTNGLEEVVHAFYKNEKEKGRIARCGLFCHHLGLTTLLGESRRKSFSWSCRRR